MHVTLLGTGSPIPDPNRAGPATLVHAGATRVLVDAGRGTVMRLAGAACPPALLDAVVLTHLHSDHISALNDVFTTRWVTGAPDAAPLRVFGPIGSQQVVDATLAMLELDRGYRCAHHHDLAAGPGMVVEVTEVGDGDQFSIDDIEVSVRATDHRPVTPTVGFRLSHDDKHVAIAGDTVPCDGLAALCAGADISVHTVLHPDQVRSLADLIGPLGSRFVDILDYHSTIEQAATVAEQAGVATLMLTHLIPGPPPGTERDWAQRAIEIFSGDVVIGPDLTSATA